MWSPITFSDGIKVAGSVPIQFVLFSFTIAYYTKKLPRKVPRGVPVIPTYYNILPR